MNCKQAEELMIDPSQTALDPALQADLAAHLSNCPGCASFRAQFLLIQQGINAIKDPIPSKQLLQDTSSLCHNELIGQTGVIFAENVHRSTANTPKYIWVAPVVLLIITIVWALPILKELANNQIMTQQTVFVFTIIVQNILMLILAPLLLRRFNLKSNWIDF